MLKVNLSFAKIVATPTPLSWSQAYNAGNFFVVLSLTAPEQNEDDAFLTTLGKKIIDNIETEFFGLENKNLETIKEALLASVKQAPDDIELSIALAYIKDQILYALIYGAGNIILKRDANIGSIVQRKETANEILSASGYIKQNDVIVIQTKQFAKLINKEEINSALELTLPNDIAETLTPHVHNSDDGGESAIIVSITGVPTPLTNITPSEASDNQDIVQNESTYHNLTPRNSTLPKKSTGLKIDKILNRLTKFFSTRKITGNKKNLMLMLLALIIISVLTVGLYLNFQKKKNEALKEEFKLVYEEANEKYKEAIGIKSLNPVLSAEILRNAESIITDNLEKFPKKSEETAKLLNLQREIAKLIKNPIQGKEIKAVEADEDESPTLSVMLNKNGAISATEDQSFIYILSKNGIAAIDKNTTISEEIIKNEGDWIDGLSLGTYQGNLYVLDKENGVIKFVVAQDGYGKNDYFTGEKPDFAKAISMAIDGSIWILSTDSKISKFTRGENDNIEVKGLDILNKPIQIVTSQDMDNIYVLDSGNGRIIQIQKDGVVKNSYLSAVLTNAKAFSINKDENEFFVLSQNKIWKLSL